MPAQLRIQVCLFAPGSLFSEQEQALHVLQQGHISTILNNNGMNQSYWTNCVLTSDTTTTTPTTNSQRLPPLNLSLTCVLALIFGTIFVIANDKCI